MSSTTILIVDDDEDARLLVGEIARLAGYESRAVGNFPEARKALAEGAATVLLDIVMPDQLCVRIAAFMAEEANAVPVILMSGAAPESVESMRRKLAALGLNVVATLRKPFWVDELLEAMAAAIPHAPDSIALASEESIDEPLPSSPLS
jgi:DNA-binding NtrC family response regulator